MPLYLSGTSGVSSDGSVYANKFKFLTAQRFTNESRTSLGSAPSADSRVILWSFNMARSNASADIYMHGFTAGWQGSNGAATYWWRINSGTWYRCGSHNYIGSYGAGEPLAGFFPASAYNTTGSPQIDFAYVSNTGRPFNVWNPTAADHVEYYWGAGTHMNIYEVLP